MHEFKKYYGWISYVIMPVIVQNQSLCTGRIKFDLGRIFW